MERGLDVDATVALGRAVREHIKGSLGAYARKREGVNGMNWHVCTSVFGLSEAIRLQKRRWLWTACATMACFALRAHDLDAVALSNTTRI